MSYELRSANYESLLSDSNHHYILSKLHSVLLVILNYVQVLFAHLCSPLRKSRWGGISEANFSELL